MNVDDRQVLIGAVDRRAAWAEDHRGDVAAEAKQLKEQGDADLVIFGHGRLSRTLLKAGLVDELRILVHPVLAGRGELFFSAIEKQKLKLSSSMTLPSGVVILIYAVTPAA